VTPTVSDSLASYYTLYAVVMRFTIFTFIKETQKMGYLV
jgi:hypothetical protein